MSQRLSVAVLSHGYWPRIGGIERQRGQVTPRLVASGAEVVVLTRAVPGSPRREVLDGVDIRRLPAVGHRLAGAGPLARLAKPLDSLLYSVGATTILLRRRPDLVHTHEFISTARTGLLAGRLLRIPVIVTSHRSGPLGDVHRNDASRRGRRLMRRIREQAALAIGVSREIDAELAAAGIPAERRLVVHNGVDTDRFRPPGDDAERASLRVAQGLPAGPCAVFVGRLAPEKRVALLLDVWPAVVAACPAAHLVVVGSGPERDRLVAQAPPSVMFVGEVLDPAPLLRAADIFVLPSAAEGLSNALLEAQASGLPAVLTDVGAARDVVDDGVNGLVVPVDDADALRDALVALLADADRRSRMAAASRRRAVGEFSIDSTVSGFLDAYKRVMKGI
jgi:glycosyltransferase involved in cell wall biosynthesis